MPFQKGHKLNTGENNPMFGSHRIGKDAPFYGKKHKPETIEKMRFEHTGENSSRWKGDNTKYNNIHIWIRTHFPPPEMCEECNKIKPLDLANITGIYNRDINNYRYLCRSCHKYLDYKNGL